MITTTKYPTLAVYNLKTPFIFLALHIVRGQEKPAECEVLRQKCPSLGTGTVNKRPAVEGLRISYRSLNLYVYLTGWLAPKQARVQVISPAKWQQMAS